MLTAVRNRVTAAAATPLDAALAFVLSRPEVDVAVIGVTARYQLDQVLDIIAMPPPDIDWAACALDDPRLLTPSLW
jgi:aryl-alcohol dehydrogenase-like predicted oxidoreductase